MIKQRLDNPTGDVDIDKLLGAKVRVISLCMNNGFNWNKNSNEIFTIDKVFFKISIDGKCYTIITLLEIPDRSFTLKDLLIIKLNNGTNSK